MGLKKGLLFGIALVSVGVAVAFYSKDSHTPVYDITTEKFWIKAKKGSMTGAFGVIHNNSNVDVYLVDAKSKIAMKTEVHLTKTVDGISKMEKQDSVKIPAGEKLVLKMGSYHIMFMGLKKQVKNGDTAELEFTFKSAPAIKTIATSVKTMATAKQSCCPPNKKKKK